jgi:hypothetical protein
MTTSGGIVASREPKDKPKPKPESEKDKKQEKQEKPTDFGTPLMI